MRNKVETRTRPCRADCSTIYEETGKREPCSLDNCCQANWGRGAPDWYSYIGAVTGGIVTKRAGCQLESGIRGRKRTTRVSGRAIDRVASSASAWNEVVVHRKRAGGLTISKANTTGNDIVGNSLVGAESLAIRISKAYPRSIGECVVVNNIIVLTANNYLIGIFAIGHKHVVRNRHWSTIAIGCHDAR